jgi:hypothetical protein
MTNDGGIGFWRKWFNGYEAKVEVTVGGEKELG